MPIPLAHCWPNEGCYLDMCVHFQIEHQRSPTDACHMAHVCTSGIYDEYQSEREKKWKYISIHDLHLAPASLSLHLLVVSDMPQPLQWQHLITFACGGAGKPRDGDRHLGYLGRWQQFTPMRLK